MLLISIRPSTLRACEDRTRLTDAEGSRWCSRFLSHSQNLRDLQVLTIASTKLVKYASFVDWVSAASPTSIVLQLVYLFHVHQAEGKWPKTARAVRHLLRTNSLVFFIVRSCGRSVGCKQKLTCPLAKHLANVKKMLYIAITLRQWGD